jgi:hypothetical protein
MSLSVIPSTELIARLAAMRNPSPEKVWKLQHALQVNEMRTTDPVCLYRNCLHHYSQHGKSWIIDGSKKRKRCKCSHIGRYGFTNQRIMK